VRIRKPLLRAAGGAAVLTALLLLPPIRTRALALPVVFEALGRDFPRPFAPEVRADDSGLDGISGRLYTPGKGAAPILLVPGAAPAGVTDSRANLVARALARAGREVFIPDLDLYRERFTENDLKTIARAVVALSERSDQRVTVLGVSYGGSFALVAASDPIVENRIARIAVLGSYFDLVGLIQAITTGVSMVGGEEIPWEGHSLAREILYARATELAPETERSLLIDALAEKHDPEELSPETQSIYELLVNDDPGRSFLLAERLGPDAQQFLARFSPASAAGDINVPVLAMHSTDDPVVPYGELIRLGNAMSEAETLTVSLFQHVDFDAHAVSDWLDVLPDLRKLWYFATWSLSA